MIARDRLVGLAAVLAGLVAWHLAAARAGPLLLASPVQVLWAFPTHHARLLEATATTAEGAVLGLVVASLLGISAAGAAWASDAARAAIAPYAVVVQVVPIVAIAPLLVTWLGYGVPVAAVTAAIAAFYPVYAAATTGLRAPLQEQVDLLRLLGASRLQELLLLRVPASLPATFAGLRSAAGLAVIGAIVGEFVGSNGAPASLGWLVLFAARSAKSELSFAAIVCAAALAFTLHAAVRAVEARAVGRWYGA